MLTAPRTDDLRPRLTEFAQRSIVKMPACINEESTKLFLVMPLLGILGFDYTNPFEVHPEHAADFSGSNKVDLAILRDGKPIIAVECKRVGADLVEERGQLRGYFNALVSTKLGILTNGMAYEFFVDSAEPNIMDDEPFLTLDLEMIARVGISEEVLDGLRCMTKEAYDPEHIAEAAYIRLVNKRLRTLMADEFSNPSEEFCRHLLRAADVKGVRKEAISKHYGPMIKAAIHDVARLSVSLKTQSADSVETSERTNITDIDCRIITTERELEVFAYVRRRLAFLIKNEAQFAAIEHIYYKDYIGKMRIYYARELKGRLFDFIEGPDGYDKYIFPDPVGAVVTNNILDIDAALKAVFAARVNALSDDPQVPRLERLSA